MVTTIINIILWIHQLYCTQLTEQKSVIYLRFFSVEIHNLSCDLSQLPIFEKDSGKDGHLDDGDDDEGQADLSDSEESVFSGLEESGSDSDDEDDSDEDEEEDDEEGDDDVTGLKSSDVKEDDRSGGDFQLSTKDITEPQVLKPAQHLL